MGTHESDVQVEVAVSTNLSGVDEFRGRMRQVDFEALVVGSYTRAMVSLSDSLWSQFYGEDFESVESSPELGFGDVCHLKVESIGRLTPLVPGTLERLHSEVRTRIEKEKAREARKASRKRR